MIRDNYKDGHQQPALRRALEQLRGLAIVPAIPTALGKQAERVLDRFRVAVLDQIPAYTDSGNPEIRPELDEHMQRHQGEVLRLLGGGAPGPFEFVSLHARRRATQHFPLEAVLQTFSCMRQVFLPWIRDAALTTAPNSANVPQVVAAVTAFNNEYVNAVGALATSEYVLQTRLLAEVEGDQRSELLNMLLSGYDESDSHVANLLRRAGYLEQRQAYCVVVAQSADPREMRSAARARRLADSLAEATRTLPGRQMIGVRDNLVVAVLSDTRRQSGWTPAQSLLADRLLPALLRIGPAAIMGLSSDAPSTAHIPRAMHEARIALDFASVRDRVVLHSRIPVRHMMVHHAQERMQGTLPAWVDTLLAADKKGRNVLTDTLRGYAAANMNLLQAAKTLGVHPNTIYARFERIKDLTGHDAKRFNDLNELLLATDCRRGIGDS
ncbi:MAG TPA: helix-turn-helix domain-containing protein [Woeseiaceae bacterium]|nr:helix-turn-helix domain-containing protein [Woeseiaceae bacterium]